jgi:predicted transcriptional regulator
MSRIAVTEAESAVLAALWRLGPLSAASLIDEVKRGHPWGDATIKTLLHRLMGKGAVKSVKQDGRQLYHPMIDRQAWLDDEIDRLVERLFDGDRSALLRHLGDRTP